MKRILVCVLIIALVLPIFTATLTYAHDGFDHCQEWQTGREFGQHHAQHAQEGMLGKDQNPGNHQGYSECVP